VHAYLTNGTRPTTKNTKVGIAKKFLRNATVARDGLLVVKQSQPFLPESELIIVPVRLLHGLLTSLHITLNHPTIHQLTNVFNRSYFSININDNISKVVKSCTQCQALETIPRELITQTTSAPPTVPLLTYAADVLRRCKQFIFALRDTFSSFTVAQIYTNENHNTLRTALITTISSLRANPQTSVNVRVDNAPGFQPLKNDTELSMSNIHLDFGRIHNINKNPVVEKGIREITSEILRANPEGGPLTESQLAVVINQLNSRIRNRGLSAWEILNQRNQYTGEQMDIDDLKLSEVQSQLRAANQAASAKHKARGRPPAENAVIQKGSLIYIKSDKEKHKARERFLVTEVTEDSCTVQKFVKSQLRAKKYQLKLSEVYPVQPEPITLPGMIRELDCGPDVDGEEDEEAQDEYVVTSDHRKQPQRAVPDCRETSFDRGSLQVIDEDVALSATAPVEVSQSCVLSDEGDVGDVSASADELLVPESVDNAVVDLNVTRPHRKRSKPSWMTSGDFVVGN
jgi:hypothetical protein